MKRLLEEPAAEPLTARAQSLLQVLGATVPSEERARRVRRALDTPPRRAVGRWAPRLVFAVSLVAAGAAAAGLGAFGAPSEPPNPHAARSASTPLATTGKAAPRPQFVPPPASAAPAPSRSEPAPRSGARSARVRASTDVARVHEAARALSQGGDAARALSLLEREPIAPGSPLAEEALALRIRASAALRNGREGKLAKSYLSLYPRGRYRELVTRALSESNR